MRRAARVTRAFALAFALASGAACRRAPEPFGPYTAFLPVAIRSNNPGKPQWAPKVSIENPGASAAVVRLTRWPPDAPDAEETVYTLAPGETRTVSPRIPPSTAASFFFEGSSPFRVSAAIVDRRRLAPSLPVPALEADALARPRDRLVVGPIVDTPAERSHFCFTWPGVERDAVPFRVRVRLTKPSGGVLWEGTFVLTGLPYLVDDPWQRFHLPPGSAFDVETTFLGGVRGRPVARGMWVYGVTTDRATGVSRFLPTRVLRSSAR